MRKALTTGLLILCVLAASLTAYLIYNYATQRSSLEEQALSQAQAQMSAASQTVDANFSRLMTTADQIATDLSTGDLAYSDLETRMRTVITTGANVDGLAITFEPFAYDPQIRLFQTYIHRDANGVLVSADSVSYDYTELSDETAWYRDTIQNGAGWHGPFLARGVDKILVEYGVPFFAVGADPNLSKPVGIVTIDYSLKDVHDLIKNLQLGATGYGFILSSQGTFVTHPVPEFVVRRTIFNITRDEDLKRVARNALQGASDFLETNDPITGETTWYFFGPIGSTGYTMGIVLNKAEFEPDPQQTLRDQVTIALALACTVFLGLMLVFRADRFRFINAWGISAAFSVISILLIVFALLLTNQLQIRDGVRISSKTELDRYIQGIDRLPGLSDNPVEIPTGVLIRSVTFPDPTSAMINGYIWQRYDPDSNVVQGFTLPQRTGMQDTIQEVQREVVGGREVVVWYIGVTLKQSFDSVRFPFDHRNITIRITPADLRANILLTPDLAAYELLTPHLLPGVDDQATINNWSLERSEYSYATENEVTGIGRGSPFRTNEVHELRFSIQAQRVSLGPFIAYLLPGLIAAIMTFTYLISGRRVGDKDEIVSVLNFTAALFFVVVVIHTALRDLVAAVGITYLEYLYVLLYLALLSAAANIFMVARFPDFVVVRYRDNLIPKVLYWPVFTGIMLVSTLLIFVY